MQIEHAHGNTGDETVEAYHKSLLTWVRSARFPGSQFEEAKLKLLRMLEGLSTNIGFESLRGLARRQTADEDFDIRSHLENARSRIDSSGFLASLAKFSTWEFDKLGLDLDFAPDVCLKAQDVPIVKPIDPDRFKDRLFEITRFDQAGLEYQFKPSASGGFFMMSLQLRPAHHIGFGDVSTVFGLSTLAHEIGHSTSKRDASLEQSFLTLANGDDGLLISNEDDSYFYEKVFMQYAKDLLWEFGVNDGIDLAELLRKRKAIQNNLHLLKHRMNWLYFTGTPFEEIDDAFSRNMAKIYPAFQKTRQLDWLKYATLDQPISRIGYLTAYQKVFAPHSVVPRPFY